MLNQDDVFDDADTTEGDRPSFQSTLSTAGIVVVFGNGSGSLNDVASVLKDNKTGDVVVAVSDAPYYVVQQIADVCRSKNVPFRTLPNLRELIGRQVNVNRVRDVDVTDLLQRSPAKINEDLVSHNLYGQSVLVTGAGGSIGRELCMQVARFFPKQLVILGHGENSIVETLAELDKVFPKLNTIPVIADLRDLKRIEQVLHHHNPNVIFHAAAHKHVPLMQFNVEEVILNNVQGTLNLVNASLKTGVNQLVMISTDKAVCPTSVYGASKRIGEMIVIDAAHRSGKQYSVVRFGNVLGSRGSVIPVFKRQIEHGEPVTVTHPDMERYFMTIQEAVHLVLQAFVMGNGGDIFVLNMGEQIKIISLAHDLIRLSGLEPGKDVQIKITGIRPGEKLSEVLLDDDAVYLQTDHPDVSRLDGNDNIDSDNLVVLVSGLIDFANNSNPPAIIRLLNSNVPGSRISPQPK